jgi:hypothetical protein
MRVLLAGWFSFDEVIATVGDELGADVVARWLTELGVDHDVAWAPYMERGVDWRDVDPAAYTHLVFVSGPLADRPLLRELTETFAGAQRWAVNVSVVQETARVLFDRVWERDAPGLARPDLAVEGPEPQVPVVAVAFTPVQGEYGERSQAERVRDAIEEWLADRALPWFELDMDLYEKPHARRPAPGRGAGAPGRRRGEHAAARAGARPQARPVVACDPIAGGAKVASQAAALDWPLVVPADELTAEALDAALARCLSGELAERVRAAGERGRVGTARARAWFEEQLAG